MPYRLSFRLSIVTLATNRGKGLDIPSGSEPGVSAVARGIKPITWHYTHRNLLPQIIWRESKHKHISSFDHFETRVVSRGGMGKEKYERRELSRVRETEFWYKEKQDKNATRKWDGTKIQWARKRKAPTMSAGRRAFCLFLTPARPRIRGSPRLNLAAARGFPRQRRASLFIVG